MQAYTGITHNAAPADGCSSHAWFVHGFFLTAAPNKALQLLHTLQVLATATATYTSAAVNHSLDSLSNHGSLKLRLGPAVAHAACAAVAHCRHVRAAPTPGPNA